MVRSISVQATGPDTMKQAEEQITQLLRQRHRLRANQENDFSVRNLTEAFSAAEESAEVMSILLGAIASISLLVGGIGIMNIMLVSVTERTREIGVRKALGARRRWILAQFLFEAMIISMAGGTIGVLGGAGVAKLVATLSPLPAAVKSWAVLLGLGFSSGVGVFFGLFPARAAAKKDPIVALRYE
jgi:putative ABC transport system permease protein